MIERSYQTERFELIKDLRTKVVNYDGPIEESPFYAQLARLLVSECVIDKRYFPER